MDFKLYQILQDAYNKLESTQKVLEDFKAEINDCTLND